MDAVPSRDRRDRYRTWFHLDAKTGAMTTTDGWRIPENLARMCTCDGLGAIVLEQDGVPFSVGRSQHIVPDRTRRIIERRDRAASLVHRGPVRRGPPHHPLARRRPDRHLEPVEPLPTTSPHAPPRSARYRRQRRRARRHRLHRRPRFTHPRVVRTSTTRRTTSGVRPYEAPPVGRMNWDWVGLLGRAIPTTHSRSDASKPTTGRTDRPLRRQRVLPTPSIRAVAPPGVTVSERCSERTFCAIRISRRGRGSTARCSCRGSGAAPGYGMSQTNSVPRRAGFTCRCTARSWSDSFRTVGHRAVAPNARPGPLAQACRTTRNDERRAASAMRGFRSPAGVA